MSLAAYLPQDRRLALTRSEALPEQTQGTALFADIAGFTPLTEALDRALGPRRGAEALVQQINRVYEALVAEVDRHGGSVLGFAGDSITCWFDQSLVPGPLSVASAEAPDVLDEGQHEFVVRGPLTFASADTPDMLDEGQGTNDNGQRTALHAVACALALQAAMRQFAAIPLPGGTTTALALKVAVASGPARRLVVGDPAIQLLDVLAGATLARMAAAEHLASSGEIVLDEATVTALGDTLSVAEWRMDVETGERFAVLAGLQISDFRLQIEEVSSQSAIYNLQSAIIQPWLLPAVYERQAAGLGEFLAELRPVAALFLRFAGIDYDGDPDAGARLDSFIRRVQAILVRYEGTLLQITIGDKGAYLYATVGAPTAHEDDAVRAAHAALACLALPDELDFLRPLQVGISYGVLCVGAYGGANHKTYGALGDEVNLAARLMSRAAPGEALVSGRVRAALADTFTLEALEPIALKGMPEPLPVFRLAGLRRREVRLTEPAYALPMVGRQAELARIGEKLDQALHSQGQVVGVIAEAGMGKSRLVAETIHLARRRGLRGFGGACQSYGANTPYLVWASIWRAFFDLDPEMPSRRQVRVLEGLIHDWAPERVEALPLLGPLLGLNLPENDFTRNLEPQYRKSALEALLLQCLAAAAHEAQEDGAGLLLVLEDLHWIDAASHDLLEEIARAIVELPILVVLAYRPPELLRLQAPRVEALAHFVRIVLAPLTEAEAAQVIRAKLAQLLPERKGAATPALIARIIEKAQGNPFYVEELLNYLRDRGIDPQDAQALDLPSSLHTLILSRIDQLSARQQATLKVASVIGRLFRFTHLHGAFPILGASEPLKLDLDELAKLELTPLDTPEPELAYLFKHIVTQEVAYESLTVQARASLHEQLAAYLERLAGDDAERYLDLLAYHYERSDNLAKKREYLRRAGEAAAARFANDAAVDYLSRALKLAPDDEPAARYELLLARVRIYDLQAARDTQAHDVSELEALAEQLDDNRQRAAISLQRAVYAVRVGDPSTAEAAAARGLAWAEAAGDIALMAENELWWGLSLYGQLNRVAAHSHFVRAHELACAAGYAFMEPGTLKAMAMTALYGHGDYATAHAHLVEGLERARAIGDRQSEANVLVTLGDLSKKVGLYREAEAALTRSVALARSTGDRWSETFALGDLAMLAATEGAYERALEYTTQTQALAQAIGERGVQAFTHMLIGHVEAGSGRWDAAAAAYRQSYDRYKAIDWPENVQPLAYLARSALMLGDTTQALAQTELVLMRVETSQLHHAEEPLRAELICYQVLRAANDPRADAVLERAHARLQEQAAKITNVEMRRAFLENVPYHREIVAAWAEAHNGG